MIIIALLCSAFFSGMEIAFLSSNKLKIELDKKQGQRYAVIINRFLEKPETLLSTLLMGNNISLVLYGISFAATLDPLLRTWTSISPAALLIVDTVCSTVIVLFTAEFLPKALCRIHPQGTLRRFAWLIWVFYILFFPITKCVNVLSYSFLRMFGIKMQKHREHTFFDKSDLMMLANEVGGVEEEEQEHEHDLQIFQNALDFSEVLVRACMVPRKEMAAIESDASLEEIRQLFIETGFSRIPVFEASIDHIVGYVHSKDLFTAPKSIKEMMRPLNFVSENVRAQKLLASMTKHKESLAIVTDEFGGTSGMVTLEDLMEEIFGEIRDESDKEAPVEKQLSDQEFLFSARLSVKYLNRSYDLNIPESDEYETLAGYITYMHESLPKEQEILSLGPLLFTIVKTSPVRVETVQVRILEQK
ncbi:MAG: hemolysin family protein [Bacteroidetes bacterium]|nr:hemolysin family protein [Bacteroidota bacterium]